MTEAELNLRGVEEPELVFGLVGALGSPMNKIVEIFKAKLRGVSYETEEIHLSHFLDAYELRTPKAKEDDRPAARYNTLMSRGNELREAVGRGDALAMHAAVKINKKRDKTGSGALPKRAFLLRQLKHPDEVKLLRQIYGDGFHVVGVYSSEGVRGQYLRNALGMNEGEADQLIKRDAGEELRFGQQVAQTFHLADLIVRIQGWGDEHMSAAEQQVERYIDLLFGGKILTPTVEEYGMFLAHSTSLRSSDLSRQVGAAILTDQGEVISLGANEVPKAGGGQYWGGEGDERDFIRGYDSNERLKWEVAKEVLQYIKGEEWESLCPDDQKKQLQTFTSGIADTRLMNLTEFGRSVHAEMEALMSAARMGISVRGHVLYTTTFPCHNCAKHIIGAGLSKVVYVEPYSKSLADRLHSDAIAFSLDESAQGKVLFETFSGVTPRRFSELSQRLERTASVGGENSQGEMWTQDQPVCA